MNGNSFGLLRARHLRIGRRGENIACRLLRSKQYDVLVRNCKYSSGEIDIVARDGRTLVFVEVKTRFYTTSARPSEGLSLKQKKRIINASRRYLRQIENPKVPCRYDLIEVRVGRLGPVEVRHWLNHFSSEVFRGQTI